MHNKVLIVGAGPVGLTVAIQLARYGVSADLIDKGSAGSSYSKALSVSAASLKAFHGLGLAAEILQVGKPIQDIEISFNRRRCARIDKRNLKGLYDYYLSLAQPETEAVLKAGLQALGQDVRYGHALQALEQDVRGVTVQVMHEATGQVTTGRYDYVVGCDGAQSSVRQLSGIAFDGYDYDVHFVMGDVLFERFPEGASTAYHVHDDGFLIFLPMPGGLTRLVVSRPGPLPQARPAPERAELQAFLDRFHGQGLVIRSVQWSSSARFFNRLASTNHQGRVFLAGDAFHLFSPIGGQGMNTGLQDAMNLSWKLAYFIQGLGNAELLNSYRAERYTAVQKVAALSEHNTHAILRQPQAQAFEARYTPVMANRRFFRHMLAQQFSGLTLDHTINGDTLTGKHVPYLRPRAIATQGPLTATYDIPQLNKNVLYLAPQADATITGQWFKRYGQVVDLQPVCASDAQTLKALRLDAQDVCLVRPDGYVGFSGSAQHCADYLKTFYG